MGPTKPERHTEMRRRTPNKARTTLYNVAVVLALRLEEIPVWRLASGRSPQLHLIGHSQSSP